MTVIVNYINEDGDQKVFTDTNCSGVIQNKDGFLVVVQNDTYRFEEVTSFALVGK